MPRALVHAAGTPTTSNTCYTCEQERWACHDQSDGVAEAECFDNTGEIPLASGESVDGKEDTYVGKKELKEQALKWKFCMRTNNHVLLSRHACLRPSIMLTGPSLLMRSRSIRA
jgi:hypothetical protein